MKRCLLVGAAPSAHEGLDHILETQTFDAVFAVDGGFETLEKRGIVPTAVFGDFDSLGYVPVHPAVAQFDTHKDFTDLDWAINYAQEQGFEEVVVCDAFVGRLDHTLGNLQLLIQAAGHGLRIWGITEEEVIAPLVGPGPFSLISFDAGAWGTCSVISHSDKAHGVTEMGLEYGLEDALCLNKVLWGVSNELIGTPARISVEEGTLWVMFPLKEFARAHYDHDSNEPA